MAQFNANYFKLRAQLLWQSYLHMMAGDADAEDLRRWLQLGDGSLREANTLARSPDLSVSERQKLQAAIVKIVSTLHLLREPRVGGGLVQQDGPAVIWDDVESAFENRIKTSAITNRRHLDLAKFLADAKREFIAQLPRILEEHISLKVNAVLAAEFVIVKDGEQTKDIKYFNTKTVPIYSTTDLGEWFVLNVQQPIDASIEEFQEQQSGWSLRTILNLVINMNKFNPMRGSSYIDLPDFIKKKKACVNVMNDDDLCFKWAILSALHPVEKNANRVRAYSNYKDDLNFEGIEFPVNPKQIGKFEQQNDVSVNLYFLKKKGKSFIVLPRHLTVAKRDQHVNLLLVENNYVDEEEEEELDDFDFVHKAHYVWIKNLSKLVSAQLSAHGHKTHICDRCLHYFVTAEKLAEHVIDCKNVNECKVTLPCKKDSTLQFKNYKHQNRVPFVVYADFESLLRPVEGDEKIEQKHEAYSVGYYVKCSFDDSLSEYKMYRRKDDTTQAPATWFAKNLETLAFKLQLQYGNPRPMKNLTVQELTDFCRARICYICKKPFTEKDNKVKDHCHFTGEYRGPAHNSCNIGYQDSKTVPVMFHNLSGYDAHLFIKEIATCFDGRVYLLPQTKEKYISFTKYVECTDINLRFIDSFRFMASSLDKLSSYLERLDTLERVMKDEGYSMEQIKLMKRKGVYPYDYVSALDKLEKVQLPAKEDFFSNLYQSHISDVDYQHAEAVWAAFNIQTLGQYSDLYLKTDVLLLTEVFENFRDNCMQSYGLDPAHYYTTPGLTWDAMLKYTQIRLELLTDVDMLMFIERGIRGGISQCCNRYAKSNNRYMEEGFRPDEDEKYLVYYDVNNLYGWGMQEPLPYGGFKWVENVEEEPNFFDVPDDNPQGFILEVDLEYPQELHDAHKDMPFCAEHMAPPGSKQNKLMTTLHNKKRYVIHYRALKQALDHGLRLKKIHRALQFNQSRWLKSYIDLNSLKRKNAKNEFEKMLFKLFNNAVYGKTMENERKHVDIKLVTKWAGRYGAEALIARPDFHSNSIFDENLVAVQLMRTEVCIKKPIYIGLAVLDVSKVLVYRFHYDYMLNRVGPSCKLLYTDTDSLVYEVTNVDVYDMMRRDIQEFDTSDYPQPNVYDIPPANKKIVGLMKDECNGDVILEFVGLRSKMYSVRVQNQNLIKKAKGVKTSVVKASISFEDYVKCLQSNIIMKREQRNIRSRLHQLYTEKETKIALSAHDDKRYVEEGVTDTLPWGHFRIPEEIEPPVPEVIEPPPQNVEVGEPAANPVAEPPQNVEVGETAANHNIAAAEPPISGSLYQEEQQEPKLIQFDATDEEEFLLEALEAVEATQEPASKRQRLG